MKLTKQDKEFFERLTGGKAPLVIVESRLCNVDVRLVATLEETATNRLVQPLAILINDELFPLLQEPKPDKTTGKTLLMKKKKQKGGTQ